MFVLTCIQRTYNLQFPGVSNNRKLSFDPKRMSAGAQGNHTIDHGQQYQCDGDKDESRKECGHECIGSGNANCIHINGYACVKNVGGLLGDSQRGQTSGFKYVSSRTRQNDVREGLNSKFLGHRNHPKN